jgi:aldose 1-epimerase
LPRAARSKYRVALARYIGLAAACALGPTACRSASTSASQKTRAIPVVERVFGRTRDGVDVKIFTLTNARGMVAKVTEYGATLTELWVPDRDGKLADVVLGYDRLEAYLDAPFYLGATLGRVANRIANGKFTLDGHTYTLVTNRAPNHLHGGVRGFDKRIWMSHAVASGAAAVVFTYTSPDGEEGYPGTLHVSLTYRLTDANELHIEYLATSDKPTPINLTNHSFFNLAGSGTILRHQLTINATQYTLANTSLVPTGELGTVVGTPLDFTRPRWIGDRIEQMRATSNGYDHNFVISRSRDGMALAARLEELTAGRVLEIWTTEPGLQFFTGNRFDGTFTGVGGVRYEQHAGVALEPQHFPDAVNHPEFPSVILRPGQTFRSSTEYRFTTRGGTRE